MTHAQFRSDKEWIAEQEAEARRPAAELAEVVAGIVTLHDALAKAEQERDAWKTNAGGWQSRALAAEQERDDKQVRLEGWRKRCVETYARCEALETRVRELQEQLSYARGLDSDA